MAEREFVTIIDINMPPEGTYYECAFRSQDLATARSKKRWMGQVSFRVVDNWIRTSLEAIEITHIPTGVIYPAHIVRLDAKP